MKVIHKTNYMKSSLNGPSNRILYSDVVSSVETWKLECNIEIKEHTKKSNKNNKKNTRLQLLGEMRGNRINFFAKMNY